MLARVVFGVEGGRVDSVAARLVEGVGGLPFGVKLRREPLAIADIVERPRARRRLVVDSGVDRVIPDHILRADGMCAAYVSVLRRMYESGGVHIASITLGLVLCG